MPRLTILLLVLVFGGCLAGSARAGVCDKCNWTPANGGCKCDNNCNCLPSTGGAPCDKCNIPLFNGGCKCDSNCNCVPGGGQNACDKCNYAISAGGCKCNQNCNCCPTGCDGCTLDPYGRTYCKACFPGFGWTADYQGCVASGPLPGVTLLSKFGTTACTSYPCSKVGVSTTLVPASGVSSDYGPLPVGGWEFVPGTRTARMNSAMLALLKSCYGADGGCANYQATVPTVNGGSCTFSLTANWNKNEIAASMTSLFATTWTNLANQSMWANKCAWAPTSSAYGGLGPVAPVETNACNNAVYNLPSEVQIISYAEVNNQAVQQAALSMEFKCEVPTVSPGSCWYDSSSAKYVTAYSNLFATAAAGIAPELSLGISVANSVLGVLQLNVC